MNTLSTNRRSRRDESRWYGPCGRCGEHWTAKKDQRTPGVCRFCLVELKATIEASTT